MTKTTCSSSVRFDFQLNDKQSMFFRMLDTHYKILNSFSVTPDLLTAGTTGANQLAQSYAIGHTYVLSNNLVQSFRIGFQRTAAVVLDNNSFDFCQAGVQNFYCAANPGQLGSSSITGGFPAGTTSVGVDNWFMNSGSVNDDLNWIKGSHQMVFGVGAMRGRANSFNDFAGGGQFTFNGSVTGVGLGDFFTGQPSTFFQGLPNSADSSQNFVDLYFTDSWRITPRLTLNLGIRWEPYLPMSVDNGQISDFDMNRFLQGIRSTQFLNAPYGFYFPGDPGFPGQTGVYKQWDHFDPRGASPGIPKGTGKCQFEPATLLVMRISPAFRARIKAGRTPGADGVRSRKRG